MSAISEDEFSQQKEEYLAKEEERQREKAATKIKARTKSLSSMYGDGLVNRDIGLVGIILITSLFVSGAFFSGLLLLSYFSSTKPFVFKIMSYLV